MPARTPAAPLYAAIVRALREQGRSKLWLHGRSGVGRNTIDRWRTQRNPPQPRTVLAVAGVLGIGRDEALRLAGIVVDEVEISEGADLAEVGVDAIVAEIERLLAELRRRIPPES